MQMANQPQPDPHCRVLIVEDEIAVAIHLEDLLLENGYGVVDIAMSVDQALDCLDRCDPDAVLLDLDLHGQKATPIAVELRKKGIPFVLETAQPPDALTGTPFEGAALVQKPWKEHDVLHRLSSILLERTQCEAAHSAKVFSFAAADRAASKASGGKMVERPDLLKSDHPAPPGRLLPIKHDKVSAPRASNSGSHFPGLPANCTVHMDVHAIHGEVAELAARPRQRIVPKERTAAPGLSAARRGIGLKQV